MPAFAHRVPFIRKPAALSDQTWVTGSFSAAGGAGEVVRGDHGKGGGAGNGSLPTRQASPGPRGSAPSFPLTASRGRSGARLRSDLFGGREDRTGLAVEQ